MLANGKYSGAGLHTNPFAFMNDGLIDLCWLNDPAMMGIGGVATILDDAKKRGGIQVYKKCLSHTRGKHIVFTNKGVHTGNG